MFYTISLMFYTISLMFYAISLMFYAITIDMRERKQQCSSPTNNHYKLRYALLTKKWGEIKLIILV
jgi:hypothetical protein